jgi:hypothetical protein
LVAPRAAGDRYHAFDAFAQAKREDQARPGRYDVEAQREDQLTRPTRFLSVVLLVAGCSHVAMTPPGIRFGADYVNRIVVDVSEDQGWGPRTCYTVVYTAPDVEGCLVVSGTRPVVRRLSWAAVSDLVRFIEDSGVLHAESRLTPCDDCARWDVAVRINYDEHRFVVTEWENRPELAKRLAALAGRERP